MYRGNAFTVHCCFIILVEPIHELSYLLSSACGVRWSSPSLIFIDILFVYCYRKTIGRIVIRLRVKHSWSIKPHGSPLTAAYRRKHALQVFTSEPPMGVWRGNYKFDSDVLNHRRDFQAESSFQEKNMSAMGPGVAQGRRGWCSATWHFRKQAPGKRGRRVVKFATSAPAASRLRLRTALQLTIFLTWNFN